MELRAYLRALARNWVLFVALAAIGAGVGGGVTLLQPPVYTATAKVYVGTQAGASVSDLNLGTTFVQQAVKTYADIATTSYVLSGVIDQLGLNESTNELAKHVTASAPLDEAMIEISVDDSSAPRSAQIANAISSRLSDAVTALTPNSSASATTSPVQLTQVQPAFAPEDRTSPSLRLNLLIGIGAGLLLALLFVVLRAALDTRVHGKDDVAALTDAPVVASILYDPNARKKPLVVTADARSAAAEAYRVLRTSLQFVSVAGAAQSVVMTSSAEGEGKTTTTANLALTVAAAGESVIVVDADLRRPSLAAYFGLDGALGLTDVLLGRVRLEDAILHTGAGLRVLPAGSVPPNPSELLQSPAMRSLIAALEAQFDTVLFDAPPTLPVTDAVVLAQRTGGALVVVAANKARRGQVQDTLETLEQVGARVLGVVLTMVPETRRSSYTYGSASQPAPTEAPRPESGGGGRHTGTVPIVRQGAPRA